MTATSPFTIFLAQAPLVLFPGGLGTELQRRGYQTRLPLWSASANLDAPELVAEIHRDYLDAGADVCVTNTFRTTPRAFRKVGREAEAREALRRAVAIAREEKNRVTTRPVFVAGSFAPLEDCYQPELVPGDAELAHEHGAQAEWLAREGVDFLLAETINTQREAIAMCRAAAAAGLPFMVSFVVSADGKLLDGSDLLETVEKTDFTGRFAVAVNCRPPDVAEAALRKLVALHKGATGIYPNGLGRPHDDLGWAFETNDASIARFVGAAREWKKLGAKIIGGCCGTTPDYIRALSKALG